MDRRDADTIHLQISINIHHCYQSGTKFCRKRISPIMSTSLGLTPRSRRSFTNPSGFGLENCFRFAKEGYETMFPKDLIHFTNKMEISHPLLISHDVVHVEPMKIFSQTLDRMSRPSLFDVSTIVILFGSEHLDARMEDPFFISMFLISIYPDKRPLYHYKYPKVRRQ
jgi:hypothetical protein